MKKIVCALFGCLVFVSAFADGTGGYGTRARSSASVTEKFIPRDFIVRLNDYLDQPLTAGAIDIILAKYDELAATEAFVVKDSLTKKPLIPAEFIYEGTQPLRLQDIDEICNAAGLNTQLLCNTYFINPIMSQFKSITFHNVCKERNAGAHQHCVRNVFVKEYSFTGSIPAEEHDVWFDRYDPEAKKYFSHQTRKSLLPYAQQVEVSESVAQGFAIEYARMRGHAVICDDNIEDNWVNCTSTDNKHFYTFKFADTHSTSDPGELAENLIAGICALFESEMLYEDRGHYGLNGCKMDCSDKSVRDVIGKFGLEDRIGGPDICYISSKIKIPTTLKFYLNDQDMSMAFQHVQVINTPDLRDSLKTYIRDVKGIEIESFYCDYGPGVYAERKDLYTTPFDKKEPVLHCHLNGEDVDFVFDDLYESAEYARKAGYSGIVCLIAPAELNEQFGTKFDGKSCIGPNRPLCTAMFNIVPGGTRWDEDADRCVLNDAETAKDINFWTGEAVQIFVDIVAITISKRTHGASGLFWAAVSAGLGQLTTTGQEWLDRIVEKLPNRYAKEFLVKAATCRIDETNSLTTNSCNVFHQTCAKAVLFEFFKSSDFIMDGISDEQAAAVAKLAGLLSQCVTKEAAEEIIEKSKYKPELKMVEKASVALMIADFLDPKPTSKFKWFKNYSKFAGWLKDFGKKYMHSSGWAREIPPTYAFELSGSGLSRERIPELVEQLERRGFTGRAFVDPKTGKDIFEMFEYTNNAIGNGEKIESVTDMVERLNRSTGVKWEYKSGTESNLHYGHYRVRLSGMSDADAQAVSTRLKNAGVPVKVVESKNKGNLLVIKEEYISKINNLKPLTKAEKIQIATRNGNLGYHGTDANISMEDMIRPSTNTSSQLGSVGYGIAREYKFAQQYAIRRLIERQNTGSKITFKLEGDVLVVRSDKYLNLSNKKCYVYTTAKNPDISWTPLDGSMGNKFDAARMPDAVEVLDKKELNIDELVRQGKVKIIQPKPTTLDKVQQLSGLGNDRVVNHVGKKLNNQEYVRVYVEGLPGTEIETMVDKFQKDGLFVSSGIDYDRGKKFIAVSDKNIFTSWNGIKDNWWFVKGDSTTLDKVQQLSGLGNDRVVNHVGKKLNNQEYVRVYVEGLPDTDIETMVNKFRKDGLFVSSGIDYDRGKKFIAVSDKNIFTSWNGIKDNWWFVKGDSTTLDKVQQLSGLGNDRVVNHVGKKLNNQEYVRVYVEGLPDTDIETMVNKFRKDGLFVSSGIDYDRGKKFIAVSDKNIFTSWNGIKDNWLNMSQVK